MTFKTLAEYFQKLESTASRNSMVEILAGLFKEASPDEIDKMIYLTQGRVAPLFEPVEFGMADKMVVKALARAYSMEETDVTAEYKKVGDLGKVAEELQLQQKLQNKKQSTVEEVFLKLQLITATNGEGSVERKVNLLSELISELGPLENRFLARIPVDKMRLGFSDMTVIDALSWMIDGTKLHKEKIESAYNIRPDLGYISTQVKKRGIPGISHVEPAIGTPILVMRAERLTTAQEILEKVGGKAAIEPKLDGLRTQLHISHRVLAGRPPLDSSSALTGSQSRVGLHSPLRNPSPSHPAESDIRIFSRGMENVTNMYPDLVEASKREIGNKEVILDGETIGFDPKTGKFVGFQQTTQRKRKYDVEAFSKSIPVKLVVYDVLYHEGKSMINEPYTIRRELVEKLTKNNQTIIAADMEIVDDAKRLQDFFEECLAKNLEGIMAKKLDGVYQAGARGWNWIKFKKSYEGKLADTIDAVVMGYDFGQGKRNAFGVGAFLVGVYDKKTDSFKTVSKIGTGLTDEEWKQLVESGKKLEVKEKPANYDVNKLMNCDMWLKPKLIGVFLSDELTKSPMHTAGFAMRFPRLQEWRTDKNPEDTTSVKEIEDLVRLQRTDA